MLSGFFCNIITNPIYIVRTRTYTEFMDASATYSRIGLLRGMRRIWKEEGFLAL